MPTIKCDIVAKDQVVFSGELYSIMVPGIDGELGILANHEPFVTALTDGVVWGRGSQDSGTALSAAIMGGYVQVLGERVIVLCDKARPIENINAQEVEREIPQLEESIASLSEENVVARSMLSRKLRWCQVQLAAKQREDQYL